MNAPTRLFLRTVACILPLCVLASGLPDRAAAGGPPHPTIPTFMIGGNFGQGVFQITTMGLGSSSLTQEPRLNYPDVGFRSPDARALVSRDTSDRFVIPAVTAAAGLSTAISSEIVRAVRQHRPLDFQRLYQNAILATGAGFAAGTLFAPGIDNHIIARAVVDAALRYLSKITWMGPDSRNAAGSFQADLIVGALRGAIESQLPAEVLTWLPCQAETMPADVCNGLHALAAKSLLQGTEEVASQLLSRAFAPQNSRNSDDLRASFGRGAAFGGLEQGIIEIVLGAPQWMSPDDRKRAADAFTRAGLGEDSVECLEKNTFLYGGLWSLFTQGKDLNFNLGTTTMWDREIHFLSDGAPGTLGLLGHEIGGHCTQWMSLGLVNFLTHYLGEYFQTGEQPSGQASTQFVDGTLDCTGNAFECEAAAIQVIIKTEEIQRQ